MGKGKSGRRKAVGLRACQISADYDEEHAPKGFMGKSKSGFAVTADNYNQLRETKQCKT